MRELGPGGMPEITEENLVESQPRVRALLMQRYELMWSVVEARIKDDREEIRPLDPRLLEIGKGILKEESALYRLGRPMQVIEEDPDAELTVLDRRELVAASLDELAAKRAAQQEAKATAAGRERSDRPLQEESRAAREAARDAAV